MGGNNAATLVSNRGVVLAGNNTSSYNGTKSVQLKRPRSPSPMEIRTNFENRKEFKSERNNNSTNAAMLQRGINNNSHSGGANFSSTSNGHQHPAAASANNAALNSKNKNGAGTSTFYNERTSNGSPTTSDSPDGQEDSYNHQHSGGGVTTTSAGGHHQENVDDALVARLPPVTEEERKARDDLAEVIKKQEQLKKQLKKLDSDEQFLQKKVADFEKKREEMFQRELKRVAEYKQKLYERKRHQDRKARGTLAVFDRVNEMEDVNTKFFRQDCTHVAMQNTGAVFVYENGSKLNFTSGLSEMLKKKLAPYASNATTPAAKGQKVAVVLSENNKNSLVKPSKPGGVQLLNKKESAMNQLSNNAKPVQLKKPDQVAGHPQNKIVTTRSRTNNNAEGAVESGGVAVDLVENNNNSKKQEEQQKHLIYISTGSHDRCYLEFSDGELFCHGPDQLQKLVKEAAAGHYKTNLKCVAFGASWETFVAVFEDGTWEVGGSDLPKQFKEKMFAQGPAGPASLVRGQRTVKHVSLGPRNEWFIEFVDAECWWGGVREHLLEQFQDYKASKVKRILFGDKGSYCVRYEPFHESGSG
ncbi:unnamed protein product [Amoebophrya sp. A120]|nr:unnamed protein product [Amoebophrya sp. A120]|eukprot:GSA120T00023323001.1